MNCANCGSKVDEKFAYCPQCGTKKAAQVEATEGPAAAPKKVPFYKKPRTRMAALAFILVVYLSHALFYSVKTPPTPHPELKLEKYTNGFFSMEKPKDWQVTTGGKGASFCYLAQDPADPLRQIVYYGEFGPVYLSERQQQLDRYYASMTGIRNPWINAPVVVPLTPENYLQNVPQLLQTQAIRSFMAAVPAWQNIQIIEVKPQGNVFPIPGAQTALIRALFTQNNKVGEGLFLVTAFLLLPENGSPGSGLGYSFSFTAITAQQHDFRFIETSLIKSANSVEFSKEYLVQAARDANDQWAGIFAAGQTLSKSTDIMMKGWQQRDKVYDIIAENRADSIRGVQRVYNPDNKEVYIVDNRFYDNYNLNRNKFEMKNLQQLPANSPLFLEEALNGAQHIR